MLLYCYASTILNSFWQSARKSGSLSLSLSLSWLANNFPVLTTFKPQIQSMWRENEGNRVRVRALGKSRCRRLENATVQRPSKEDRKTGKMKERWRWRFFGGDWEVLRKWIPFEANCSEPSIPSGLCQGSREFVHHTCTDYVSQTFLTHMKAHESEIRKHSDQ